jgi:uncharacterized membrane protein HdeD (DUF308 family)
MSMNTRDINELQRAIAQSVREHWVLFLVEGIVLVVLGLLAIVVPVVATLAVAILIGWLLLISGIVGLITTFMARQAPGFWWSLLSAVLAIAAGIVLLVWPVGGALSLTLLLVVFFVIEGVASIMYALEHKKELSGRWGWMLASGIIDLVLAVMIYAGLPSTAAWALGLLVGINMVFGGSSLIAMALYARGDSGAQSVQKAA